MAPKQARELQIEEDAQFQEREWKVERAGWLVMGLVILATLLGLFGRGPLSQAMASGPQGFQVNYERFARNQSPLELRVRLPLQAFSEGEARLWIERQYLELFEIEDIVPEPDSVEFGPERVIYIFRVAETGGPLAVRLDLRPRNSGLAQGRLGWDEANPLAFTQLIYP